MKRLDQVASPVDIQIRPAEPADGDAMALIIAASPEAASWSAESLRNIVPAGLLGWVAVGRSHAGPILGFLIGRTIAPEFEILNLAVTPACRRKGVGSMLLVAALAYAANHGNTRAFLEVRAGNHGAIALYLRHGFIRAGLRKRHYENPTEDALLFSFSIAG